MLEQQEKQPIKEQEGLDEKQLFQKTVSGFIASIPEKGPLHEKGEKREIATRAIAFGQLFNSYIMICDGAKNLTREQKANIIKRLETLKKEAYFWTTQTDSGRNFVNEINEMSQGIWRR